jgi:SMODS and SLOG-associating 2TM effector domain family 4
MLASPEKVLEEWYGRLRESQASHYEAAKACERMNYWLGIPVVILSTFVGTSVFASLGESVNNGVQIFVGLVSVAAATLASVQTFLQFSERAAKHRAVAARYGALRREIEEALTAGENVTQDVLTPLRQEIDRLADDAPGISERIWNKVRRNLEKDKSELGQTIQ